MVHTDFGATMKRQILAEIEDKKAERNNLLRTLAAGNRLIRPLVLETLELNSKVLQHLYSELAAVH